ncbi:MAG: tRNA lysidine(34) synthetase TilS [Caldilineaceae bacterium]|nr:tRNA lysidine(34) synthetase TilS [Caldilineaceae bacterium]
MSALLDPAQAGTHAVLRGLAAAQARHHLFSGQTSAPLPVVVGVSGGADSVCLLHALRQFAPHWGLALHVAHLDHALRPQSAADAAWVAALAQRLELPLHTARLAPGQLDDHPAGLEAAARAARYAFLHVTACAVGDAAGPACVAVAHHQDDQAETVLIHFLRGSGPAGLAGMAWAAPLPHPAGAAVWLVRPLLGVRRADILVYCAAYGLSWRDDASNQDTRLLRNQIRHTILPQLTEINPALVVTLGRTADLFAAEAARSRRIDQAALDALRLDAASPSPDRCLLDAGGLGVLDLATRRGVLRLALAYLGVDLRDAGLETIDRLLDALGEAQHSSGPHPLIGGIAWTLISAPPDAPPATPRRLSLHRAAVLPVQPDHPYLASPAERLPRLLPPQGALAAGEWRLTSTLATPDGLPSTWRSSHDPWFAAVDAGPCAELHLCAAQPGMKIAPLGMAGRQRSLGDLFTDHKTPVALRAGWPVLVDAQGDVVWVCGLALAHAAAITSQTQQVRILTWRPAHSAASATAAELATGGQAAVTQAAAE